jgi:hypothetical protein
MSRIVSFVPRDAVRRSVSPSHPSEAAQAICAKVLALDRVRPRALTAIGITLDRLLVGADWPTRADALAGRE